MNVGSNIRKENKYPVEQRTQNLSNLEKTFKGDPQFDINTHQNTRLSPPKDQILKGEHSRENQFAGTAFQTQRPDQTLYKNIPNEDLQKIQQELEFLRKKVFMLESQSSKSPNKANINQFTPFDHIQASPNEANLNKTNVSGHLSPLEQNSQLSPPQVQHPQWYSQSNNFSNMLFTPPYTLSNYITPFPNLTYPNPTVPTQTALCKIPAIQLYGQRNHNFQFFGQTIRIKPINPKKPANLVKMLPQKLKKLQSNTTLELLLMLRKHLSSVLRNLMRA